MAKRSSDNQLLWERDGADWPNREASQFVEISGLRWHVQRMGKGPQIVLLHGLGAATHSWRALAPLLAERFEVIAPDLPGHGFTRTVGTRDLSLSGMARSVDGLLRALGVWPEIVVGHSAGAAVLTRACIDRRIKPRLLISLNGALLPFPGVARHLFPTIAKLLYLNPLVSQFVAWSSDRESVARLLRGTGSSIDARGVELYARLLARNDHVTGALGMMAMWDLASLSRDLHRLMTPLALVVAHGDKAVPPDAAHKVKRRLPDCRIEWLSGVGHLAHEEKPEVVRDLIFRLAAEAEVERRPTCPAEVSLEITGISS